MGSAVRRVLAIAVLTGACGPSDIVDDYPNGKAVLRGHIETPLGEPIIAAVVIASSSGQPGFQTDSTITDFSGGFQLLLDGGLVAGFSVAPRVQVYTLPRTDPALADTILPSLRFLDVRHGARPETLTVHIPIVR